MFLYQKTSLSPLGSPIFCHILDSAITEHSQHSMFFHSPPLSMGPLPDRSPGASATVPIFCYPGSLSVFLVLLNVRWSCIGRSVCICFIFFVAFVCFLGGQGKDTDLPLIIPK